MRGMLRTLLVIAGSDSAAGAGLQADIKAAMSQHVFAFTVVTAITAQNSKSITEVSPVHDSLILSQLKCVCQDYKPDAIKIGLIPSVNAGRLILHFIEDQLPGIPLIVDPVIRSTTGDFLSHEPGNIIDFYRSELLPYSTVATPNIPEAFALLDCSLEGQQVGSESTSDQLACLIVSKLSLNSVIVKGGHSNQPVVNDCLAWKEKHKLKTLVSSFEKIECKNLHGTGCTYSSILSSRLVLGDNLQEAFIKTSEEMNKIIRSSCHYQFGDNDNGCLNIGNFILKIN